MSGRIRHRGDGRRARALAARALAAFVSLLGVAGVGAAEIGETVFVRGVATAQVEGGQPRLLGTGSTLLEGDVVSTANRSFAVLSLRDGTKLTLRPDTVFSLEQYSAPADEGGSAFMRLFKGGLRAVTGFISKRSSSAMRIATPSASIGIRGTEFEARICGSDCQAEARAAAITQTRSPVVARVVFMRGRASAVAGVGESRALSLGASLFEGDLVETTAGTILVISFRDGTRTTLRPDTRFLIERMRFQAAAPEEGSMFLRLLKGGMRAVTGLIAKTRRESVTIATPAASIGIRGTGFDVTCHNRCAPGESAAANRIDLAAPLRALLLALLPAPVVAQGQDGMYVTVWSGEIELQLPGGQGSIVFGGDRTFYLPAGGGAPVELPAVPVFIRENAGPRPDLPESTAPGMDNPFGAVDQDGTQPGLYVTVYDGDVSLAGEDGTRVDIGPGEAAYADPQDQVVVRVSSPPRIVATPSPGLFDSPEFQGLMQLLNRTDPSPTTDFECVVQ